MDAAVAAAPAIGGVPIVPLEEHLAELDWRQGEHVAIVGPTGQGKTTLVFHLIERRRYVCYIATKPKDPTLSGRRGWSVLRKWPPKNGEEQRVILWPKHRSLSAAKVQAEIIFRALDAMFKSGGWCIVADDTQYLTQTLGLRGALVALWLNARSVGVSLVASTQRPRWVPVECYANSSHFWFAGTKNGEDLKALGALAGLDTATVRNVVQQLPPYHFLYVPARHDGRMVIVTPPKP